MPECVEIEKENMRNLTRGQIAEITAGLRPMAALKTFTFSNITGSGALNDVIPLFKVQGNCLVSLRGYVETTLAGTNATVIHGKAGATNDLITILTCTNLTAGGGIDSTGFVARGTALNKTPLKAYFDGDTINVTDATAAITAGKINYACDFVPLTEGAEVIAL
jgi:hypothetical protein